MAIAVTKAPGSSALSEVEVEVAVDVFSPDVTVIVESVAVADSV
jgi:hypothetical protein